MSAIPNHAPSQTTAATLNAFHKALDEFKRKSGLSPIELDSMKTTTLLELKTTVDNIQQKRKSSRRSMFMKRLDPFLKSMEQYGHVIGVFVNTSNILAFVWGPMRFLLVIADNYSEAFNALLDGYAEIGQSIPLLADYQQMFESNPYMQRALTSIFEDVLEFHWEALKYFKHKEWRRLFQATWRGMTSKIAHLRKSIGQQRSFLESHVVLSQFKALSSLRLEILTEFTKLQYLRISARVAFQIASRAEQDRRREKILQLLGDVNPYAKHQEAAKRRYADTGKWLLVDDLFQKWFDLDHCVEPLIWLNGMPGAGKTVLASMIVEEAQNLSGATIAFSYSTEGLIPHLYEQLSNSGQNPLSTDLLAKSLLEVALRGHKAVYIIIDGLDEYSREDRKDICAWYQSLVVNIAPSEVGSLRCFFVSQEDGAQRDLNKLAQIKIRPEKTAVDIQAFCASSHLRIKQKFGCLLTETYDVTNLVAARSEGMFLYARLVTEILEQQDTFNDLKTELEPSRLPHGIGEAYERILQRMLDPNINAGARCKNALKLLGWLSCARRPLRWHEIQGAMAIDTIDGTYDPSLKFVEMQDCKDICGSLVEQTTDGSIVLVHSTAKHYLFERALISEANVELDLAVMCLTYLATPEFEADMVESMIEDSISAGFYAFSDYAVPFWGLHVERAISHGNRNSLGDDQIFGSLVECLEAFLSVHWIPSQTEAAIPKTLRQVLISLHREVFFDNLCRAIHDLKSRLRPSSKGNTDARVLLVYENYAKVRSVLEHLVSSASFHTMLEPILTKNYTSSWFKCSRLNCQYYHRGFPTRAQRVQHEDKHERSYTCVIEGCHRSVIGCTTLKELEKHVFEIHGYHITPPEAEYPDDALSTTIKPQKEASKHSCPQCLKIFIRTHALAIHQRSHDGTRPFECATCGKSFARKYDCQRHEKIHTGEKKYMCSGTLNEGIPWGCKQAFARSEALANHFRSKIGRKCISDLLEQQRLDRSAVHEQVSLLVEMLPGLLEPAGDDVIDLSAREHALKESAELSKPTSNTASTLASQEPFPTQLGDIFDEESKLVLNSPARDQDWSTSFLMSGEIYSSRILLLVGPL